MREREKKKAGRIRSLVWASFGLSSRSVARTAYSSARAATALFLTFSTAAPRTCFCAIAIASASSSPTALATASSTPSGVSSIRSLAFFFPTRVAHSEIFAHAAATASCPLSIARSISSTVRKSPYPSIIITASSVPARTRSRRESAICATVGLTRGASSPGSQPTLHPATGLERGTSETAKAALAAVIARASVDRTPS